MTCGSSRSTLALSAVCIVLLAACGHYGPPVHPEPADKDAATAPHEAPKADEDMKRDRHEP
jgi:predicted small lipoprotein YifL